MNPFQPTWSMLAIACLVVAVICGGGAGKVAWDARGDREDAKRLAEVRELQKRVDELQAEGARLSADLEAEKRNIKTVTVEVIKHVPSVTTVYVERPGDAPKPIPAPVFTRGFVRLWNDSLRGALPAPAGEPDGAARGADDLVRARIGSGDILTNHAENAGKYAECRKQLRALVEWNRGASASP